MSIEPHLVEPTMTLASNKYTDDYTTFFRDVNLSKIMGQQVLLVDGLEITTAVSLWGNSHETR